MQAGYEVIRKDELKIVFKILYSLKLVFLPRSKLLGNNINASTSFSYILGNHYIKIKYFWNIENFTKGYHFAVGLENSLQTLI